jgi:hypothetical protein
MNRTNVERAINRNDTVQELALLQARLDGTGQKLRETEVRRNEDYDNFRVADANVATLEQEANNLQLGIEREQAELQSSREELENSRARNRRNEDRNYIILVCAYFCCYCVSLYIKKINKDFHKKYIVGSKKIRKIKIIVQ